MSLKKRYPVELAKISALIDQLSDEIPRTMDGLARLEKSTSREDHLDAVTKALITLGIAINGRCEISIAYHVNQALEAGASRDDIVETIRITCLMGGRPALLHGAKALAAFDQLAEAEERREGDQWQPRPILPF